MAFIITDEIRNELIAQNRRSEDIIRPLLQGRDINRYQAHWASKWLIATFPSKHIQIERYPAVRQHLLSYGRDRLEQAGRTLPDGTRSRKKSPHAWFELQDTCAYHEQFLGEKLFWMDIVDQNLGRVAYSQEEIYCNNATYMITGRSLRYLCAILNSRLVGWYMANTATTTGAGAIRWNKFSVEQIPVPYISEEDEKLFDKFLMERSTSDISEERAAALESKLDNLVYECYGLSRKEIDRVTSSI